MTGKTNSTTRSKILSNIKLNLIKIYLDVNANLSKVYIVQHLLENKICTEKFDISGYQFVIEKYLSDCITSIKLV